MVRIEPLCARLIPKVLYPPKYLPSWGVVDFSKTQVTQDLWNQPYFLPFATPVCVSYATWKTIGNHG